MAAADSTTKKPAWPIQYVWQGTFRYPLKEKGHQWFYHNPSSWKIWKQNKKSAESLKTIASKILKADTTIPSEYRTNDLFPLTRWLSSVETNDQPAEKGLSTVLNSIVLSLTLKTFTIVTTFVDCHATVRIRGLQSGEPQWFYLHDDKFHLRREEEMLVSPERFFDLKDDKVFQAKDEFEKIAKEFRFIRVLPTSPLLE